MPTPVRNIAAPSADLSVGARKTGRQFAAQDRRVRRVKAEVAAMVLTEPLGATGKAEPAKAQRSPPPKPEDFRSPEMHLFRDILCNTDAERDSLSHALDCWDSIPRYGISRQQQDRWRQAGQFPALLDVSFHYRGRALKATIQPAAVRGKDGLIRSYYPGGSEELIEDVLRKFAAAQCSGYYASHEKRSGVVFTLYALRKELEQRGHGRTYAEVVLSLEILSSSVIQIATADGGDRQFSCKSTYLHSLARVSKTQLAEDPEAKWYADFHPFVSRALDELTYRQFNYARLMGLRSQLARWLSKVLSMKYINASRVHPFEMRFSTIARDSGLLNGYALVRLAVVAVDSAIQELRDCEPPLISRTDKNVIIGARGKIEDVVYTLYPSNEFVSETKAANKRCALAEGHTQGCGNPVANR
jgi:hypothetical protein